LYYFAWERQLPEPFHGWFSDEEVEVPEEEEEMTGEQKRNKEREEHLEAIAGAILSYAEDNEGRYPACITEGDVPLPPEEEAGDRLRVCGELRDYLGELPDDPLSNEHYRIGWYKDNPNRVIIWSTAEEAIEGHIWAIR